MATLNTYGKIRFIQQITFYFSLRGQAVVEKLSHFPYEKQLDVLSMALIFFINSFVLRKGFRIICKSTGLEEN